MNLVEAVLRTAERTYDNSRELRKQKVQRRTEFTDLYGIPFTAQGDSDNPATFYVSISPDLEYFMRFQFKLHIQPFITTVTGGTSSTTVSVNNRSLSVDGSSISPNPHNHSTDAHTHNVIKGISVEHTTASDFRVYVHDIDITNYLKAQHDGWISGEGIYPNDDLDEDESENTYDLLEVASVMFSEGYEDRANKILKPEFKEIKITSNSPFQVTMYLYTKYSVIGR